MRTSREPIDSQLHYPTTAPTMPLNASPSTSIVTGPAMDVALKRPAEQLFEMALERVLQYSG